MNVQSSTRKVAHAGLKGRPPTGFGVVPSPSLKSLCADRGSGHKNFTFPHKSLLALTVDTVSAQFFELREQIKAFLEERNCDLPEELELLKFNQTLAV